jgi:hypothetical protein
VIVVVVFGGGGGGGRGGRGMGGGGGGPPVVRAVLQKIPPGLFGCVGVTRVDESDAAVGCGFLPIAPSSVS